MEMGNHLTRVRSLPPATRWLTVSVSRRLFQRALHRMRDVRLTVAFPDQRVVEVGDVSLPGPTLRILTDDFFARLATGGKVGLGEAYTAREWEADDIPAVLGAFASNLDRMVPPVLRRLRTLVEGRMRRTNSLRGAARNIAHHYDLSNDFFSLFLDPSMTYSSAVFAEGDTLEEAQYRKYQAIAELAGDYCPRPRSRNRHRLGKHGHLSRHHVWLSGDDRDTVARAAGPCGTADQRRRS